MNIFNIILRLIGLKLIGVKHIGAVILFSLVVFSANGATPAKDEGISIVDAWVRLPPPVANNSAAYFSIINQTDTDATIVDVTTRAAETVAMHNTIINQGMSKMVHLKTLIVPSKSQVDFVPSGKHLMLFNLTEKLTPDSVILVTFSLANGKKISAQMVVGEPAGLRFNETKKDNNKKTHKHH